jgi:hypothetical protein
VKDPSAKFESDLADILSGADFAVLSFAEELAGDLIDATPVDTGRARSNWRAVAGPGSLGRTPTNTLAPYAPGRKLGLSETANASAAKAAVAKAIQTAANDILAVRGLKGRAGKAPPTARIFNNTSYIGMLNYAGSSPQAPPLFVESALAKLLAKNPLVAGKVSRGRRRR